MLEADQWLAPIEGENPSGVDLRNDERFQAIERVLRTAPEPDPEDTGDPADLPPLPVDWDDVLAQATEVSTDGRDLRNLVIVARALANLDGYAGAAEGISLITETVRTYWDNVHPRLRDAQAPRDAALRRINALMQLQGSPDGLLSDLMRKAPLDPRGIGPIRGRHLALAALDANAMLREGPGGLGEKEKAARVEAHEAMTARVTAGIRVEADQNPEAFAAVADGVAAARAALDDLQAALGEHLGGNGMAVTFPDLARHLERVAKTLDSVPAEAETEAQPVTNATAEAPAQAVSSVPREPDRAGVAGSPDRLESRKDVERCLDLIIEFYERTEPASPLPDLARRMRRMVPMTFMELIQEVAPGGLKDFQVAVGTKDEGNKSKGPQR